MPKLLASPQTKTSIQVSIKMYCLIWSGEMVLVPERKTMIALLAKNWIRKTHVAHIGLGRVTLITNLPFACWVVSTSTDLVSSAISG